MRESTSTQTAICGASEVTRLGIAADGSPELTIVVPTFNERQNVRELIGRLDAALTGIHWEVIFVDDNSPDSTWMEVQNHSENDLECAAYVASADVDCLGLASREILASSAPFVCIIDADLQHDETQIPKMLTLLQADQADLAVGSRYAPGGNAESFKSLRKNISSAATLIAQRLLKVNISDPLSGFFMIRSKSFEALAPSLSVDGFKILLDIIATSRGSLRIVEVPYVFSERRYGESKLDSRVAIDFIGLLLSKRSRNLIPSRFALHGLIGTIVIFTHLTVLYLSHVVIEWPFAQAQIFAAMLTVPIIFSLNNELSYRERRLHGTEFVRGLISYYVGSSIGLVSNVSVALVIYHTAAVWWLAGIVGALVALHWSCSTWPPRQ